MATHEEKLIFNNRYIPVSKLKDLAPLLEDISKNIKGTPYDDIETLINKEGFDDEVLIDDESSLVQLFNKYPELTLEKPLNHKRMTIFLMACALSKSDKGIKYLIKKGAEINRTDIFGNNALMFLICNQVMPSSVKLRTIRYLINKGIDINWINGKLQTPLAIALEYIEIEAAHLLMENGGVIYTFSTDNDKEEAPEDTTDMN